MSERYERLRAGALGEGDSAPCTGRRLLLCTGLGAWVVEPPAGVCSMPTRPSPPCSPAAESPPVADTSPYDDVVYLLSEMLSHHLTEEAAAS